MSKATIRIGFPVLMTAMFVSALTTTAAAKPALSQEQVTTIVIASKFGITAQRAVEIIRERGIRFVLTDGFLKELEAMEADSTILTALKELGAQRKTSKQAAVAPGTIKLEPDPAETSPATPKMDLLPTGTVPTAENWPRFLESVRTKVLNYTDALPDFACNQGTREYQAIGRRGWTPRGIFEVEVAYYNKSPHYQQLSHKNAIRPVGEFGAALRGLFAPPHQAIFKLRGLEKRQGRETAKLSFEVPRKTSSRSLSVKDKDSVAFGYHGRCWVDLNSYVVIRLESESTDMPKDAPIAGEQLVLRYKEVMLAENLFWLPAELHVIVNTKAMADGGLDAGGVNNILQATDSVSLRYVSFFQELSSFRSTITLTKN